MKKRSDSMDLLQLRYFYESAKTENFSHTAQMFRVPTTSVSASIKRLEQELGCKLFDRTSNRIHLNEAGRKLQRSLCTVFHEMENVMDALSCDGKDTRQINILVRGMRRKITDLIIQYSDINPNVTFRTVFDHAQNNFQEYDIIIDDKKEQYDGYERLELFSMRLCLRCSEKDPLCQQKIQLSELCNHGFISMDPESNMHKILTRACNRAGFTPKFSAICNDIECYEKFIRAGMGIGIARQDDNDWQGTAGICDLDVTDFIEHYTVYAYYSKSEYYGEVKAFVDFLRMNV